MVEHDAASAWVERFAPSIPEAGTVLDLACGGGRHTRYLRDLGFRLVAADIDVSRVEDLASDEWIEIVEVDLESGLWPFEGRRFDGIVVTNYLHRPLLPLLAHSLAPGGVLIYETFAKGHEEYGRPQNPSFLLEPGELERIFGPLLEVIAYEHAHQTEPRPSVRQRLCARRAVSL
jgi:SAM-dependent methyltransferase